MLQAKLNEGLARYDIGTKLRALRLRRKMGLAQLGKETGLSTAMLSKIERGRLFPTLPTLYRIAVVFGVGLEHFFVGVEARSAVAVLRKQDRVLQPYPADGRTPSYYLEPLDFPSGDPRIKAYYAEFERHSHLVERHSHAGMELLFVIQGTLAIVFADHEQVLQSGDAISFEADRSHGYARRSAEPCSALVIVST